MLKIAEPYIEGQTMQWTNNYLPNPTQKTKDLTTPAPLKLRMCSGAPDG